MKRLLTLWLFLLSGLALAQSPPLSFTIERSTSPDFSSPVSTTTTSTSLSVAGLSQGTPYYFRIKGSNGTVATTSAYTSLSVTTTSSGTTSSATSLTFANAEALTQPMTLFAGPPPYYQGTSGVDWGGGGNTGLAGVKIPAGADGWARFQFTANTQVAIGFDSLNVVQRSPTGYQGILTGVFVYNQNVGVVRNGALIDITPTKVAAVGSYLRVRRAITGGVASYFVEYSTDGTTWSDITPAPVAPATKFFTSTTTGDLFIRAAINGNNNLVKPESSSSTVR